MSDATAFAERFKDVRRLLAEPGAAPADGEEEYRAFASGRVGSRPQVSLTFCRRDGRSTTLAYSHLYAVEVADSPNLGCTVEFTRHRVTLSGRNLAELVRLLGDHKVREVRETDEVHALALAPDAPVVTAIEVLDTRDGGEW